jgi:aspartate/methionine/tyrosine aminotransferase
MKFPARISAVESSAIRKMYDMAKPDSINLGIGMPFCNTSENIKEAGLRAIKDNKTFYTSNLGLLELREVIADEFNRTSDNKIDAGNILVTVGVAEAIFLSLFSLLDKDDEILIPDPGYTGYSIPAQMIGCKINRYPLLYKNKFSFKINDIIDRVTENTKVILLNSPGNPTGGVISSDELSALGEYCQEKGISIISDEIYSKLNYTDTGVHSISSYVPFENLIVMNGISKEFAMTGWRVGWVISSHENIKQLVKVHQVMASCASTISQYAAIEAIRSQDQEVINAMANNKKLMGQGLSKIPNIHFFTPEAGLYFFPDFSYYGNDYDLAMKILNETNVITIPGSAFGSLGKGYLRLSFGAKPEDIVSGLSKINELLKNY